MFELSSLLSDKDESSQDALGVSRIVDDAFEAHRNPHVRLFRSERQISWGTRSPTSVSLPRALGDPVQHEIVSRQVEHQIYGVIVCVVRWPSHPPIDHLWPMITASAEPWPTVVEPAPATFRPSDFLMLLVREGMQFFASASENAVTSEDVNHALSLESSVTFGRRLKTTIGNIAYRQRSAGEFGVVHISANGDFTPEIQLALIDVFPVPPMKIGIFLQQLHTELKMYLLRGGAFKGNWGHLSLSTKGNNIELHILPR